MKSLTSPVSTTIASDQLQSALLFDFYLKDSIVTPQGTTNRIRITDFPGNLTFFNPKIYPEPVGTRGASALYYEWPVKKGRIQSSTKSANDQMTIIVSNVSTDFAHMLNIDEFRDVQVIVRQVCPGLGASATADDCTILFSGNIDDASITRDSLTFTCSNDLVGFNVQTPRENMHAACRFQYGDDMCGKPRLDPGGGGHFASYVAATVGVGSTTSRIVSSDLSQDNLGPSDTPTDEIDALGNALVSQSNFSDTGGASCTASSITDKITLTAHGFVANQKIMFRATTMPAPLSQAPQVYFVVNPTANDFQVASTSGGAAINLTTNGTGISVYWGIGYAVKASGSGLWKSLPRDASDGLGTWGTSTGGYWEINSAQQGLKNPLLEPFLDFDLGAAKQLRQWKIRADSASDLEELPRLMLLFSSTDYSTWLFERYIEFPRISGATIEASVHEANTCRYWRLCVRSRWTGDGSFPVKIKTVSAYIKSRFFWVDGFIQFNAATTTVALRNLRRRVTMSWNGAIDVPALPIAPVNGDLFTIQRGCPRTFNGCSERLNTDNFGGFDSLPYETVIR